MDFEASRASALNELNNFVENNLSNYSKLRNFDFGPEKRSNVSCLSPYITHGIINEKEVIEKSLSKFSFSKNEKFIQEVLWRTYWKGWLELRPNVWSDYLIELNKIKEEFKGNQKYLDALKGKTNIECFNAWINELKNKIETYQSEIIRTPSIVDTVQLLSVGFGVTAVAHFAADFLSPFIQKTAPQLSRFSLTSHFFWLIVLSTTIAAVLSSTRLRNLEGVGASRYGSIFIYILVATIGMKMDISSIFENLGLFVIGVVWMLVHAFLLIVVAKIIKAPFFFVAVGSQANVGGAASAPIVASAFHPSLAPVGVLLAVLGYAVGTYAAWLCGILMQIVSA